MNDVQHDGGQHSSSPGGRRSERDLSSVNQAARRTAGHLRTGTSGSRVERGGGFAVLGERTSSGLLDGAKNSAGGGAVPRPALTEGERQVLRLTGRGLPPAVVAERLGVPQLTVARHLSAVRRKYGVRSSVAAADVARRSGQIE